MTIVALSLALPALAQGASTKWSGASPIVPSTSSWPSWPIRTIV